MARQTYFTPYDDAQTPILNAVIGAKKKIRIAAFTFTNEKLTQAVIARFKAGVDVQMVLDLSQSISEPYEIQRLVELRAAGIPIVLGKSSKHQIMHNKFIIIDDYTVVSGSFNFTVSAELENNVLEVEKNRTRAALFNTTWQKIHDYISANLS